jgi:sec-independent protein translocase protein TatC
MPDVVASEPSPLDRYLPYLIELQKKLIQVLVVFLVSAVIGGIYHRTILGFIMHRFDLSGINVVLTSPYQIIELAIQTGIYTGILFAIPLLIYHLLTFLKPALEPKEYKILISMIPLSIFLFFTGFMFGAWVMNFIIQIFTKAALDYSVGSMWDIGLFFSQILFSAVALGIVFQFPIVITILLRFKLIQRHHLTGNRPYVYTACLIFAAMLPPTDVFSLILLTIPLFFLFELTLILNRKLS